MTSADSISQAGDIRFTKTYYFHATLLRRILTPILRLVFRFMASIQYQGVEHLPQSGPVVLAANHLTNFDVFPMQFVLPRPIFFMGKAELFQNPPLDWLLRQLGGFPVFRGAHDEWALDHARQVLEHDQILGIFPEGKRSKGIGLRPAKTGAARLAIRANAPVVPMAVHGTEHLLRRFPRRAKIRIILGKPLYPQANDTALELTDQIMFTLAEMLPAESRGVYDRQPVEL